jgi:predicted nucleic acid-binding protein
LQRMSHFVQPYAVLSLGPMASSRSVELMMANAISTGLNPLDALIAATALAHEIPLVAIDPRPFLNIAELSVLRPY